MMRFAVPVLSAALCFGFTWADKPEASLNSKDAKTKILNVLFVGNSYTARHNLADVVKRFAEAGDSQLDFKPTQVIYGGRTLKDHWRLGTQHFVNAHRVTADEVAAKIASLESDIAKDDADKYARNGLKKMRALRKEIESGKFIRTKWDWVVLQSYRDDLDGDESLYMQYAPKFVALAKEQGAKVLLYETTPTTQNAYPISQKIDTASYLEKAKSISRLAKKTDSRVAPMCYVGLRCQSENPALTLRFENDAHLNQTMAYLSACTIYAAMFDRSPEGLDVESVTDIRYWKDDRKTKKDRDGKPIETVFSKDEQAFLQATAWEALQEFHKRF